MAEAGVIDISWNDPARHAMATITGEIGNRKIASHDVRAIGGGCAREAGNQRAMMDLRRCGGVAQVVRATVS